MTETRKVFVGDTADKYLEILKALEDGDKLRVYGIGKRVTFSSDSRTIKSYAESLMKLNAVDKTVIKEGKKESVFFSITEIGRAIITGDMSSVVIPTSEVEHPVVTAVNDEIASGMKSVRDQLAQNVIKADVGTIQRGIDEVKEFYYQMKTGGYITEEHFKEESDNLYYVRNNLTEVIPVLLMDHCDDITDDLRRLAKRRRPKGIDETIAPLLGQIDHARRFAEARHNAKKNQSKSSTTVIK